MTNGSKHAAGCSDTDRCRKHKSVDILMLFGRENNWLLIYLSVKWMHLTYSRLVKSLYFELSDKHAGGTVRENVSFSIDKLTSNVSAWSLELLPWIFNAKRENTICRNRLNSNLCMHTDVVKYLDDNNLKSFVSADVTQRSKWGKSSSIWGHDIHTKVQDHILCFLRLLRY